MSVTKLLTAVGVAGAIGLTAIGDGPAPWGFGPPPPPPRPWGFGPPPPPWAPPPPPFEYWGQTVTPVFDADFGQWGFWFFGIWVAL